MRAHRGLVGLIACLSVVFILAALIGVFAGNGKKVIQRHLEPGFDGQVWKLVFLGGMYRGAPLLEAGPYIAQWRLG